MAETYELIGVMSGSSLDGLDVAWCTFEKKDDGQWSGRIEEAGSFFFPAELEIALRNAPSATALAMVQTEAAFVRFSADCILEMCKKPGKSPLAVASHGHTLFHNPAGGYTIQIGNGGILSGYLNLPVVSDFRTQDVGLGGQGAPLVPGAERFLFSEYDACLNLGGICNISFPKGVPFLGFDLAPCNQLLNEAAGWLGLDYDKDGKLAASGTVLPELMSKLSTLSYYQKPAPKSLGNEEVAALWKPLLNPWKDQPENTMHTLCLHIAEVLSLQIENIQSSGKMLVTGGGAFHTFLIDCISKSLPGWNIEIPDPKMVSFKEAYCFAFLGLKRILGEANCFAEVTGASSDSSCGALYGPTPVL